MSKKGYSELVKIWVKNFPLKIIKYCVFNIKINVFTKKKKYEKKFFQLKKKHTRFLCVFF